ncbi:hypothetical protein STSO111631_11165 [Stackebrandtia soli]
MMASCRLRRLSPPVSGLTNCGQAYHRWISGCGLTEGDKNSSWATGYSNAVGYGWLWWCRWTARP